MYIIVGLGNPEPEYSNTRHNMGFDVINILANKNNINLSKSKFDAICGTGIIQNEKVMLVKPQTYMNNSGEAIRKIIDFYKESLENIIVIYDDMDTQIGNIRIRSKGGPGSHNGMKSIVEMLSSENFSRIRVGIGKPIEEFDRINYVIGKVKNEENAKEWLRRNRLKKSMLTILTSACPLPSQSYLNALDDWVDGKLTIEELIRNSDKGLYLEDRNGG